VAFDDSTDTVDFYTPGGQHIRGFEPGFRPAVLEVARDPLRLTFGMTVADEDSIPRLMVIQTDFLGENPDTLLGPGVGPETVRGMTARGGTMMISPSESGLWVFSREVPDTVFEVTSVSPGRRFVLPENDTRRVGVIVDLEEQVLWVVTPRPDGGLDYEAFDLAGTEPGEFIDAAPRYLGARKTPSGYVGKVAVDGAMIGWWNARTSLVVPRAYDMRIAELRDNAEAAREARPVRRGEIEQMWQVLLEEQRRLREEESDETIQE
jgi:hypothetical protein